MTIKLKPCPFCGGEGWVMSWGYMAEYPWTVECRKVICHARSEGSTREDAIDKWNCGTPYVKWASWMDVDYYDANFLLASGVTEWGKHNNVAQRWMR